MSWVLGVLAAIAVEMVLSGPGAWLRAAGMVAP